jgi:hypothetical protein
VVELVRLHRLDDADVVGDGGEMREDVGDLGATLAVPGEGEARAEHGGVGADEGVALAADDRWREGLALELGELRLVVEEVELAGGAGHEQVNDGLGLALVMRRFGGEDVSGSGSCASFARQGTGEQ